MSGWLVIVSGKLDNRSRGALGAAGMAAEHHGGTRPSANLQGFTVAVDSHTADEASVKVAEVLRPQDGFTVQDVMPSLR
jgi:hypothetical protein